MADASNKLGLAFSGGGYRAAAYHVGTLRALHRMELLDKIDVISSVSGGSITAAYYVINKDDYESFENSLIDKLHKGVMAPVWGLLGVSVFIILVVSISLGIGLWLWQESAVWGVVLGFLSIISLVSIVLLRWYNYMPISNLIAKGYDRIFFVNKTLGDLPASPLLTINSTNIATNLPFSFSQNYMGEFVYTIGNESIFTADCFPLSKAVMASSCVPYGFTPIKIDDCFLNHSYAECPKNPEPPLLVDGGIYDNQGAHKLSMKKSRFYAKSIIVSDAGNSVVKASGTNNFISALIKTSDMMMNRIKNLQFIDNLYHGHCGSSRYAYIPLKWDISDSLIYGFVRNLYEDNVHPDVWSIHGITEPEVAELRLKGLCSSVAALIIDKIKANIDWENILLKKPSEESELIARNVGTNLTALSSKQINALIAHSEWMTYVQVRLYLPYLIKKSIVKVPE